MGDVRSVAHEAHDLVYGERGQSYGHPFVDYKRATDAFNALTDHELSVEDGILFMQCVKLSREQNQHSRDNLVDLIGYTICLERVKELREQLGE